MLRLARANIITADYLRARSLHGPLGELRVGLANATQAEGTHMTREYALAERGGRAHVAARAAPAFGLPLERELEMLF